MKSGRRLFARSESKAYFERLAPVLGAPDLAEFKRRLVELNTSRLTSEMFNHHGLPVTHLGSGSV